MNLNHLVLSGNLTRDPEMRSVGADRSVTSFTLAHNTKFKAQDGELREEVSFIDCEAWGRQGEIVAQYCQKGHALVVEGSLRMDAWTDKEGQKRSRLKVRVERAHLVPRRDGAAAPAQEVGDAAGEAEASPPRRTAAGTAAPTAAGVARRPTPARARTAEASATVMDDPPF